MSSIYDFLNTEASSSTTGGVNAAEGQDPSTVNDGIRQLKQLLAAFIDDLGAVNTVGGTATAVTVTLAQGFTAYGTGAGEIGNGTVIALKMSAAATGAATLNVNSIGAKKIRRQGDTAIVANDWLANGIVLLRYDTAYDGATGAWVLLNPATASSPSTNDGAALGASGTAWSDLFLASGGVINWNSGDVTISHSANTLSFAGASSGYIFDAAISANAVGNAFGNNTDNGAVITFAGSGYIGSLGADATGVVISNNSAARGFRVNNANGTLFSLPASLTVGIPIITLIGANTTASAASCFVDASGGLYRSTSALKYKTDLQPVTDEQIEAFLGLTGYSYRSLSKADDPAQRFFGVVADHADAAGLPELVVRGPDGEIEGYAYGRDIAIVLEILKRQQATNAALEARIEALEALLGDAA